MGWRERLWDIVPFVAMVTAETLDVSQSTLCKAAMSDGMSPFVYVVYYNSLGTLLLFPSYMFQRGKHPPLTYSLLCRFFLLGVIGICFVEMLGYAGIRDSSPTLASALGNLVPAFTFILALIFRMETLNLRISASQAKFMGIILSITGMFIVTLYKGQPIFIHTHSQSLDQLLLSEESKWVIGGILLTITFMFVSLFSIAQTATMKVYPSETTIVFYYVLFGTIPCAIVSWFIEKDQNAWTLGTGKELVAIAFSAVFGTIIRGMINTWSLHNKGPVFVSMFRPLRIIIAAALGVGFLGDTLQTGCVIGAIVIVIGFYAVMWGKANETEFLGSNDGCRSDALNERVSLLPKTVTGP